MSTVDAALLERHGLKADEYARIVAEIEDDFDALLGRAFLKAYQAQLQALAADRHLPDLKG